ELLVVGDKGARDPIGANHGNLPDGAVVDVRDKQISRAIQSQTPRAVELRVVVRAIYIPCRSRETSDGADNPVSSHRRKLPNSLVAPIRYIEICRTVQGNAHGGVELRGAVRAVCSAG